jgi:hypothetical protein
MKLRHKPDAFKLNSCLQLTGIAIAPSRAGCASQDAAFECQFSISVNPFSKVYVARLASWPKPSKLREIDWNNPQTFN